MGQSASQGVPCCTNRSQGIEDTGDGHGGSPPPGARCGAPYGMPLPPRIVTAAAEAAGYSAAVERARPVPCAQSAGSLTRCDSKPEEPLTAWLGEDAACRGDDAVRPRFDPCNSLACVADRAPQRLTPKEVLFGERTLRQKLLRAQALESEEEALTQMLLQYKERTTVAALAAETVELVASRDGSGNVDQPTALLQHPRRSNDELAIRLGEQQLVSVRADLAALQQQVVQGEALIVLCFDQLSEEDGAVAREQFVSFVCGEASEAAMVASPEDAELLFDQMSGGQPVITFEQLRDEITLGCLIIMQSNIRVRRELLKKYRDCWF